MALQQVFADGMIIGEIPVVNKGDVDACKGVGAGGMPDAPFGRETLVGDPNMGVQVPDLIIIDDGFRESDVDNWLGS